ncbi:MAG: hypothetical protein AAFQ92_23865, partial [Bacteroidota bacterium]
MRTEKILLPVILVIVALLVFAYLKFKPMQVNIIRSSDEIDPDPILDLDCDLWLSVGIVDSEEVLALQKWLNRMNAQMSLGESEIVEDGDFGPLTEALLEIVWLSYTGRSTKAVRIGDIS